MKLLIVDDEIKICQLINKLINWQDLHLTPIGFAHDGLEGLRKIRDFRPDIVITDIKMPGMDGLELIAQTQQISPQTRFIIISGYQEFKFAQTAMQYGVKDYLLKPIDQNELSRCLTRIYQEGQIAPFSDTGLRKREKLRENLLIDLIYHGDFWQNKDINQINQDYFYHFRDGIWQCFILNIHNNDSSKDVNEEFYNKLRELLNLYLPDLSYDFEMINTPYHTGIINYAPENSTKIDEFWSNLLADLKRIMPLSGKLHLGIGGKTTGINKCSEAWQTALAASQTQLLKSGDLHYYAGNSNAFEDSADYRQIHMRFIRAFEKQNSNQIEEAIQCFTHFDFNSEDISATSVIKYSQNIIKVLILTLQQQNIKLTNKDLVQKEAVNQLETCTSLAELADILNTACQAILQQAADFHSNRDIKPIRIAKTYIQDHYRENIKLEDICQLVGYNESYFSSLFKQKVGISYLEYLTQIRIMHAQKLLINSNQKIASICLAVGYNDLKNFNKKFKKITGISPSEFRKVHS